VWSTDRIDLGRRRRAKTGRVGKRRVSQGRRSCETRRGIQALYNQVSRTASVNTIHSPSAAPWSPPPMMATLKPLNWAMMSTSCRHDINSGMQQQQPQQSTLLSSYAELHVRRSLGTVTCLSRSIMPLSQFIMTVSLHIKTILFVVLLWSLQPPVTMKSLNEIFTGMFMCLKNRFQLRTSCKRVLRWIIVHTTDSKFIYEYHAKRTVKTRAWLMKSRFSAIDWTISIGCFFHYFHIYLNDWNYLASVAAVLVYMLIND